MEIVSGSKYNNQLFLRNRRKFLNFTKIHAPLLLSITVTDEIEVFHLSGRTQVATRLKQRFYQIPHKSPFLLIQIHTKALLMLVESIGSCTNSPTHLLMCFLYYDLILIFVLISGNVNKIRAVVTEESVV